MRIAIFTETYLPDVNGVATHIKTLRDGLESLGHEVLIVVSDASCHHHYIDAGILHCPAIKSKRLYNYSLAFPVSFLRLNIIRRWKPDIIHIQNEFGVGLSGVLISEVIGVPLVYTMHTMYDNYIYYIAPRVFIPAATRASHRYFKHIAKKAAVLTGASQKIEQYIRQCGIKQPVEIIPNAVELDIFSKDRLDTDKISDIRRQYGLRRISACFCGRLGEEKNIDTLLRFWKKAYDKYNDISLLIIGDGPDRQRLSELTKELGLDECVTFTGKIPHSELPDYYSACSIYTTASLSENYSISMLEAMASGLPIVHMLDRMNESQLINGLNGFPFETEDEFTDIIGSFCNKSDEELAKVSEDVRKSVENSGAVDLAKYIVDVYSNIYDKKAIVKGFHLGRRIKKAVVRRIKKD